MLIVATNNLIESMVASNIIALRYGEAVFTAALELGQMEGVDKDFANLESFLKTKGKDALLVTSTRVPRKIKQQFWQNYCQAKKLCEVTLNFINLLVRNNRLDALLKIIAVFRLKYDEHNGIKRAVVQSAVALNNDMKNAISTELNKMLKAQVIIAEEVDKRLLGGLLIKIGSKQLDFSLNSQLSKIRQRLKTK
jgi:F-type H+-transporting ATPase subunit delta